MNRLFIILFILVGISSTFMPWLYFPKVDESLYGSVGDGVVTAILFTITLIVVSLQFYKEKSSFGGRIYVLGSLALLFLIYISKIISFRESKGDFDIENPMLASAVSGYELGYGVYVLGISSLLAFFATLYYYLKTARSATPEKKPNWILPVGAISLIIILIFTFPGFINQAKAPQADTIEPVVKAKVEEMGKAFMQEDFDTFIAFNHPSMVEAFGGKRMMIEMLQTNADAFRENNTKVLSIAFGEVQDIQKTKSDLQAIVTQEIVFNTPNGQVKENQKLLAIQEFETNEWHFVSINNKSAEEIKKIFPQFNSKLNL